MTMLRTFLPFGALALAACGRPDGAAPVPLGPGALSVAPPLSGIEDAYEAAGRFPLAAPAPEDHPDLHNVYRLSANVISGSEPHSEEAFAELAAMGVRTIVSADGKAPDAEAAARHGMRYVHIPIQYRDITPDEVLRLVKTFRELPAPFYVHCFHGRHRGPAAAAIGRIVLDGAPREQALAEMRQWCGTSPKYEGLYRAVASREIPSPERTAAFQWDFPAAQPLAGFRSAMIALSRSHDRLEALAGRGWAVDPEHPDVDPVNEAEIVAGLLARASGLEEAAERPEDFRRWLRESASQAEELRAALAALRAGDADAADRARAARESLGATCSACHARYRDE